MSVRMAAGQLAALVAGDLRNIRERDHFSGVETNIERIRGGELFVAAESGQAQIEAAYGRGAALILVPRGAEASGIPAVAVADVSEAFFRLAGFWRAKWAIPVAAVAGGPGKTTVASLMAALLLTTGRGAYFADTGSDMEVLRALCSIGPTHGWLVLELPGTPDSLLEVARPRVLVIPGKELQLPEGRRQRVEAAVCCNPKELVIERFDDSGKAGEERFPIDGKILGIEGIRLEIELPPLGRINAELPLAGAHNIANAGLAVAGARELTADLTQEQIQSACRHFVAPQHRLNIRRTAGGRVIIDDSYNATPDSLRALLTLAENLKTGEGAAPAFVFGSLPNARDLIPRLTNMRPPLTVTLAQEIAEDLAPLKAAGIPVITAASAEAAAHLAHKFGFNILCITGSRGDGLEITVDRLLDIEGELIPEGTLR